MCFGCKMDAVSFGRGQETGSIHKDKSVQFCLFPVIFRQLQGDQIRFMGEFFPEYTISDMFIQMGRTEEQDLWDRFLFDADM